MDLRIEELNKLRSYTEEIDKDLTLILQSLQWERKHIMQHPVMVSCKYDPNHKISPDNIENHEEKCLLRINEYSQEDQFLPQPFNSDAGTLMKLGKEEIALVIDTAAGSDPPFNKVGIDTCYGRKQLWFLCIGSGDLEPQTFGRLQCTYSMDQRRAIYDAVVAAAPSCHDLTDLALPSVGNDGQTTKTKTRTEILAELRDMRRRRTKYRVAAKSRNYSDVLRDVINTQMEIYNEVLGEVDTKPDVDELNANIDKVTRQEQYEDTHPKAGNRDKQEHEREFSRRERDRNSDKDRREGNNTDHKNRDHRYQEDRGRSERHKDRSRYNKFDKEEHKVRERDDNRGHRDKSRDTPRGKSRESKYDTRHDRDYKRKEKHTDDAKFREHKERDRPKGGQRSRETYNKELSGSDTERARNLIKEIKREIESIEEGEDMSYKRDENEHSTGIKLENDRHDNDSHRYDYSHKDRSKNRSSREKSMGDMKEYRDKRERHKRSRREGSYDREVKRSRVEEKHRTYYKIYAEPDSRGHKGNKHEQN